MAFISDRSNPNALRTWDPDTGWVLKVEHAGPQYQKFALTRPDNGRIDFWGEFTALEVLAEVLPDGRRATRKTFKVQFLECRADVSNDDQRKLIHDALVGFGVFYDGPSGPVEVIYEQG